MKFSTRARYGMRAMLDIAVNGEDSLVLLKDIARRQSVSKRYLEHMMIRLRQSGLVEAERGAKGGYRLSRPPSEIHLDEIFESLEGSIAPVDCLDDTSVCDRTGECAVRELWEEMRMAMHDVLNRSTLEDLKNRWKEIPGQGTGTVDC